MKSFDLKSNSFLFIHVSIAAGTLVIILGKSVAWFSLVIELEHVMAHKNSSSHCEDFYSEVAITAALYRVTLCSFSSLIGLF